MKLSSKKGKEPILVYDALALQDAERQRIARDLHDTTLQDLTALINKVELTRLYIDKDPIQARLELFIITKNLREIIDNTRELVFNLRPMTFDDLGIKSAFMSLLDRINKDNDYEIDVSICDVDIKNEVVLSNLYLVAQECLFNIRKHAKATKIQFHFTTGDKECYLDIVDNGVGFVEDPEKKKKHFGLSVISDRIGLLGGTVNVETKVNEGTKVHITIPC